MVNICIRSRFLDHYHTDMWIRRISDFGFSNKLVHENPPFLLQEKHILIVSHILTIIYKSVKAFLLHMASHIQS